ncbi:MAG: hypothetical protein WAU96_04590 [Anaerolineae bacterium]|nr:hypothetical protein [Thermoflexales bacterium]HQW36481.1 hypothetical protein [Thermoflexales bacterium]
MPITGFIADAEPPLDKAFDVLGFGVGEVKRAEQNMRQFLENAQNTLPQFKQEVTSIFPLFADGFDGDNDIATLLQSPVDPPGNWSTLNLQAYTSYMPEESRTYYLWLLMHGMQTRYPNRQTSYLIGLAAPGFSWEPVLSEAELVRDARIARAMNAPEISVFHLRGALERFGDDFVARFTDVVQAPSPNVEVSFSRTASLAIFAIFAADGLLDLRGSMLWLIFGFVFVHVCVNVLRARK